MIETGTRREPSVIAATCREDAMQALFDEIFERYVEIMERGLAMIERAKGWADEQIAALDKVLAGMLDEG